jgi:hypothetical protein
MQMNQKAQKITVAIILLATVTIGLVIFLDLWPLIRGGYGWRWPYATRPPDAILRALPGLAALAIYLVGVHWLQKSRLSIYLSWCILGSIALPVVALSWWGNPLEQLFMRTVSPGVTGAFTAATMVDNLFSVLQQWPEMMSVYRNFSSHMANSPPGWVVIYYGLSELLATAPQVSDSLGMPLRTMQCHDIPLMELSNAQIASAWLGILSPVWTALTILPLYSLLRQFTDEESARWAVSWWPLVPSATLFVGTLSAPYALISATIVWLNVRGLFLSSPIKRGIYLLAAGFLTGVAILINFSFVPLLLFCGLTTLLLNMLIHIERKPLRRIWDATQDGIYFGLGLSLIIIAFTIIAGTNLLDVYQTGMGAHLELERPYLPWVVLHVWDFALFLGLPLAGLLLWSGLRWRSHQLHIISLTLVLTLLIVTISGTGRGETGRVWIFFMPLTATALAALFHKLSSPQKLTLTGAQAAWFIILWLSLDTVGTGLSLPPVYADVAFIPKQELINLPATQFGNVLSLHGYGAAYQPETKSIELELYWQPLHQMENAYFFSALLVGPDHNSLLTGVDWQPFDYQYPTTCWHKIGKDMTLMDRVQLPLNEPYTHGDWWLSLSVFQYVNGVYERLQVTSADIVNDQIGLGPIRILDEP